MAKVDQFNRGDAVAREALKLVTHGINGRRLVSSGRNTHGAGIRELWKSNGTSHLYGKDWCGAFAVRAMQSAGVGNQEFYKKLLGASGVRDYAKKNPENTAATAFRASDLEATRNGILSRKNIIRPGDIVAWRKHIGVVISYDSATGTLMTAEGNTYGGTSKVYRAMTRTYQLRTDMGTAKQQADAKKYYTKANRGHSAVFIRWTGKNELAEGKKETAPERLVETGRSAGSVHRQDQQARAERTAGKDAGVSPRAGGMPATAEQMGVFSNASTSSETADIVVKQIAGDPDAKFRTRGTSQDFDTEIIRLKTLRDQLTNWESTYPEHAQQEQGRKVGAMLNSRIKQLNTYQKEREPTPGLKGVAPFRILFDGKQIVVPATGTATKDFIVPAYSGRSKWMNNRTTSAQRMSGRGPAPEGTYWIDLSQRTVVRNPLQKVSWGEERLTIHPYKTTHTFGRGGVFFHGGSSPGSAGCIDLLNNEVAFFNHLAERLGNSRVQIPVVVDYSPERIRWAQSWLTAEQRDRIGNRMPELRQRNDRKGLTNDQLVKLEHSFGIKSSKEAHAGKVSEALVWHIAAWQQQQQTFDNDTGGVDGEMGRKTRDVMQRIGLLEKYETRSETESAKERKIRDRKTKPESRVVHEPKPVSTSVLQDAKKDAGVKSAESKPSHAPADTGPRKDSTLDDGSTGTDAGQDPTDGSRQQGDKNSATKDRTVSTQNEARTGELTLVDLKALQQSVSGKELSTGKDMRDSIGGREAEIPPTQTPPPEPQQDQPGRDGQPPV